MLHFNLSNLSIIIAKDIQLLDNAVNQHGTLTPGGLLKGKSDGAVRKDREGGVEGAQGKDWCLTWDKISRAFARDNKEEDIAIFGVVGTTHTILVRDRPGGIDLGDRLVCSSIRPEQINCW